MKRLILPMTLAAFTILSALALADSSTSGSSAKGLVTLSLSNAKLEDGIEAIFAGTGLSYAMEPSLQGRTMIMSVNAVPFDQALSVLTKTANITYTIEDGIYIFAPVKNQESAAKTTNKITIHQAAKPSDQPAPEKPDASSVVQTATQPEQQLTEQDQQLIAQQAANDYLIQMSLNQAYAQRFYQPPNYQLGNVMIMNGGYEPYSPPITIGGGGFSPTYSRPYQPSYGWQPYSQYMTPFGMQQPYYMIR